MTTIGSRMDASGKRFAVIVSRWNELITNELLAGALDELERHGAEAVEVCRVPGTWEIPVAVKAFLDRPGAERPDGVVALGCILQGQTPHARMLAHDVGAGLMSLQTGTGIPIGWGVLTTETKDQALDRSGLKMGNKGREAALATIEMCSVVQRIKG